MNTERKAMDYLNEETQKRKQRKEKDMNANAETMEQAPTNPAKARIGRVAVVVAGPICRLGAELLFALAVVLGAGLGLYIAILAGNYLSQFALAVAGLTLQDDHGVLAAVVCYCLAIVGWFRFLIALWQRLRVMTEDLKSFYRREVTQ